MQQPLYLHHKLRPALGPVPGFYMPALCFHEAFGQGQPDAAAPGGPVPGFVPPVELFEHMGKIFRRDPRSLIGNGQPYFLSCPFRFQQDGRPRCGVPDGVGDQVVQDLDRKSVV